jgi:chromatin licensing and DNA replication factor 1
LVLLLQSLLQLFSPPKLSKEEVTIEVVVPKTKPIVSPVTSPVKAGIKASPRKDPPAHLKYDDLRVPDKFLPLPRKYKFLAEVFRSVDDIVAMKFNRREIIRVSAMKPAVQNIIRKTFDNSLLRQIRCVFPKSYIYTWEKILDRLGRHSSGDYELHMVPDLNYNVQGSLVNYNAHGSLELQEDFRAKYFKLGPKERIERVKLFNHALLEIAKEYHKEFLNSINWTKEDLGKKEIFKWHPKFDPEEHCPDIDTVDFPPKPHVERISNAKDMIQKFAGIHPLLQNLAKERESQTNSTTELNNPTKNLMTKIKEREPVTNAEQANIIKERKPATNVEQPKIIKGLRGLDPAILKMLVAKEKTRTVQEITQDSEKRKRLEIMDELILVAPYIVNCHRSVKNGAAVPIDTLTKIVADSYGQGKTKEEILKHVKMFLNLVPECMELKTYDRICYLKKKKDSPDINVIKAKLRKLADQEKES